MTRRLTYPHVWAESGVATDPDLDTTHPAYVANKYASQGWHSEKPPEEWQNFLTQISDAKVLELLQQGIFLWDASVTYPIGGLSKVAGVVYLKVTNVTPAKSPEVAGSGWDVLVDPRAGNFNDLVSTLNVKLAEHMAEENPHNDTIHNVVGGGYLKTEMDPKFNSATDPKTIVYHKAQMGQSVHGETVAQLGTLSAAAGGEFSGPVTFEDDAIIQVTPSMIVHLNKATALLELANGTVSLGIAANGKAYVVSSAGQVELMTEANYDQFNISFGYSFALPVPLWSMNLKQSLSDADSVGDWIVTSDSTPVFTKTGVTLTGNLLRIAVNLPTPITGIVVAYDAAGVKLVSVKDYGSVVNAATTINSFVTSAGNFNLPTAETFESMVFYPRLSARQKTMLETA